MPRRKKAIQMLLHTIIDPYEVMRETGTPQTKYEYLHRGRCILQCIRQPDGYCLDRIISTNPKDFLNSQYQLGSIIQK